jgi:subtilase family serine protease
VCSSDLPDSSFIVGAAKYPDVTVKDIMVSPSSPAVGQDVTISAKIVNQGSGEAKGITVTFSVDGNVIATKTVTSIAAGNDAMVSASWKVDKDGEHKVTIEAKTSGDSNQNNDASYATINTAKSTVDMTQMVIYAVPIIVIVVIVIVVLLMMRKRKGAEPPKVEEKKEEQPKKE